MPELTTNEVVDKVSSFFLPEVLVSSEQYRFRLQILTFDNNEEYELLSDDSKTRPAFFSLKLLKLILSRFLLKLKKEEITKL